MIFVFLCLNSLSMIISRSIHVAANGIISLFYGRIIFHCIDIYMYHIFNHSPVDGHRLLPCLACCKQCCCKHWGAHIFLNCGYQRGKGEINQEFGIKIYIILYIKQIINKDLMYITGNYAQYLAITYNGKDIKKDIYTIHICNIYDSYIYI